MLMRLHAFHFTNSSAVFDILLLNGYWTLYTVHVTREQHTVVVFLFIYNIFFSSLMISVRRMCLFVLKFIGAQIGRETHFITFISFCHSVLLSLLISFWFKNILIHGSLQYMPCWFLFIDSSFRFVHFHFQTSLFDISLLLLLRLLV